jgi:hypothetical protein
MDDGRWTKKGEKLRSFENQKIKTEGYRNIGIWGFMEDGDRRTGIGGVKADLGPLSSDFRPLITSGRRPFTISNQDIH